MTDQEINEAVARKLGYDWKEKCIVQHLNEKDCPFHTPDYCHSIEAAFEIVESRRWIKTDGADCQFMLLADSGKWLAGWFTDVYSECMYGPIKAEADTAPMAICLAFLKLP